MEGGGACPGEGGAQSAARAGLSAGTEPRPPHRPTRPQELKAAKLQTQSLSRLVREMQANHTKALAGLNAAIAAVRVQATQVRGRTWRGGWGEREGGRRWGLARGTPRSPARRRPPGSRCIAPSLQARHPPTHMSTTTELLDVTKRLDAEMAALSRRVGILQAVIMAAAVLALLPALWRCLAPRFSLWKVATACALGYGALETYKVLVLRW